MCHIKKIFKLAVTTISSFIVSFSVFAASDSEVNNNIEADIESTKQEVINLKNKVETNSIVESSNSVKDVADDTKEENNHQPYKDMYITAKIKSVFIKEKFFGDKPINITGIKVETKNGIVYLTGKAENQEQIDSAISLAQSINGVVSVESTVKIK